MEDTSPASARLAVDTTGSDFTVPSYDIAPEDQARAQELLSASNADPNATPSPVKLTGGGAFKAPERFTLSILPPDKQGPIAAQLAQVPAHLRAEREHELVVGALKQNSTALRIKAGPGEGASPLEREQFAVARDIDALETEALDIQRQLAEVQKWVPVYNEITGEPVIDPRTGQQQVKAVEIIQGDRRKALEARVNELAYRADLLRGVEGDRRIQRALAQTIELEKQQRQRLAEREEVKRRAEEISRQKRIDKQAETLSRFKDNAL
ncbi:hypothetical protein [Porphyrobacter sp. ULC335]|uniref:hypothetical protein n=1 Tax=Porphyrobacter sp. ULC335 TaxID=2854260 RepID=UPI00221FE140|nr:hypothetical protein [Porphyrobacter sp. ULC335]UYV14447.1 hypothetical protein KVF90_09730 [Porphyrobacter sp. ULC335]